MLTREQIIVVGGNGHHDLDRRILASFNELTNLGLQFGHFNHDTFPDQEPDFRFAGYWRNSIAGKHLVVFQSMGTDTEHDGQHYAFEFLTIVWGLKHQYGAASVTAVVPFMIFRRQDHPEKTHELHRNLMFVQMMKNNGVDRLILCDIHSEQTLKNCEKIALPAWNADPTSAFAQHLNPFVDMARGENRSFYVFAPDAGAIPRALTLANALDVSVAVSLKNRADSGEVTMVENNGVWQDLQRTYGNKIFLADDRLRDADVCTRDDEITTGNTACKTGQMLKEKFGARNLYGCFTHPVCVPGWKRVLVDSKIFSRLFFGDTIYGGYEKSTGGEVVRVDLSRPIAETLFSAMREIE